MSAIKCTSRLLDVGRKTDKADRQTLNLCADHLRRLNSLTYAAEMYKYVWCFYLFVLFMYVLYFMGIWQQ